MREHTINLLILCGGLVLFSAAVLVAAVMIPQEERVYVFLSGVAGNFSGSLFTYLRMGGGGSTPPPSAPAPGAAASPRPE